MSRSFGVNLLVVFSLTLAIVLGACAPAAPATPPTTPPATTPPAATATPAAAEPAFTYDTYTSTDWGFSIKYPKKWKKVDVVAPYATFRVQPPEELPNMTISVMDVAKIQAAVDEIYAFWKLTDVKTLEEKEYIFADGKTKGSYTVATMKHPSVPLKNYAVTFTKGDKAVNIGITTLDGADDPSLIADIFKTITFK